MKHLFLLCMVIVIYSCRDAGKKIITTSNDSIYTIDTASRQNLPVRDTSIVAPAPPKASSYYEDFIPAGVLDHVSKNLKDWRIPSPWEWEKQQFDKYKTATSLVNFISGDFNCDDQKDYALILSPVNNDSVVTVWAIHSGKAGFSSTPLKAYGRFEKNIRVGLEMVPPGTISYLQDPGNIPKNLQLDCASIGIRYFGATARTYYWEKSGYKWVQTAD
jgi:hypothetical protein